MMRCFSIREDAFTIMQSNNSNSQSNLFPTFNFSVDISERLSRSFASSNTRVNILNCQSISFQDNIICEHKQFLSSFIVSPCATCRFLRYLYFQNLRIKRNINKSNFKIFGLHKVLEFVASCNREWYSFQNVEGFVSDRSICQYAEPFSSFARGSVEDSGANSHWHICNNAEHLFECSSARHQARGELVPVGPPGSQWYATCSLCSACCEFSASPALVCLFMFFQCLELIVDKKGNPFVKLQGSTCQVAINLITALGLSKILGVTCHMRVDINSGAVGYKVDVAINRQRSVGAELKDCCRQVSIIAPDMMCKHTFLITGPAGFNLWLTQDMLYCFMMFLGCRGYLDNGEYFGLLSVMGMKGVHILCNENFYNMHKAFYNGPYVTPPNHKDSLATIGKKLGVLDTGIFPIDCQSYEAIDYSSDECDCNLDLKLSRGDCVAQMERSSDENEEIYDDEYWDNVQRVKDRLNQSPNPVYSDDEIEGEEGPLIRETNSLTLEELETKLFILEEYPSGKSSGASTRGLGGSFRQRIGGLFKGIANCIKGLHGLWDYPLDKVVTAIDDTGDFLNQNSEHVSKDVWACSMCVDLQKDLKKLADSTTSNDAFIRKGLEKVAEALDALSLKSNSNEGVLKDKIESIMDDIALLKRKADVERAEDPLEKRMRNRRLTALEERMEKVVKSLEELTDLVLKSKLSKPKFPSRSGSEVGEQLAIPRKEDVSDLPFEFNHNKGSVVADDGVKIAHFDIDENPINEDQPIKRYDMNRRRNRVLKHSGVADTLFVGDEVSKDQIINVTNIMATGSSHEGDILKASYRVGDFSWKVSDGEDKVLHSLEFPSLLFTNNQKLASALQYFQYYTCDGVEFMITTTSVMMQGGTLLITWDALSSATRQKADTIEQLSGLNHIICHAGSSTEITFSVGNPSMQHQMCLMDSEGSVNKLGSLKFACVNVLNAPEDSSQEVKLNVWARLINPRIAVYGSKHVVSQRSQQTLSIESMGHMENIVARGTWTTTSNVNLVELLAHPCACKVKSGLVYQTPMSVISSVFGRWTGSLIFKLTLGNSAFVRGRLIMAVVPVQFRNKKMTILEISNVPHVIFSLDGIKHDIEIEVPYHSVGLNSLVSRDSLYDASAYDASMVVSRLHVLVLDPLVMNANASNGISYFITLRPGTDFSLSHITGVKAEFVNRTLAQVDNSSESFKPGKDVSIDFSQLCTIPSILRKVTLDDKNKNAIGLSVGPAWRDDAPCTSMLHWLSQLYLQWRGTLVFTIRAHSFVRTQEKLVRIWHDVNGSTAKKSGEIEFLSDVDPPTGAEVHYWRPSESISISVLVPFCARTERLMLPKPQYGVTKQDWLRYYNGFLYIEHEGEGKISFEISIAGGSDFAFVERGVVPKCGKVTDAFTSLSYADKLLDITSSPTFDRERLRGPTSKAVITPVDFKPKPGVDEVAPAARSAKNKKRVPVHWGSWFDLNEGDDIGVGDTCIHEDDGLLIWDGEEWVKAETERQMGIPCFPSFGKYTQQIEILDERKTCAKVADIVDQMHTTMGSGLCGKIEETMPDFVKLMSQLSSMIGNVTSFTQNVEEKMGAMESVKNRVLAALMPLLKSTLPGVVVASVDKQEYLWASGITLIGILAIGYTCKSIKSFKKRVAVFAMLIWSPFLGTKLWQLGKWIKNSLFVGKIYESLMTCRKHSLAGAFEGFGTICANFTEWIGENWVQYAQGIFSLFGIITSLVIWGTLPDKNKLSDFASKFKAAGEKGKTISCMIGGFRSITQLAKEISSQVVSWVVSNNGPSNVPQDNVMQKLVKFNVKEWVLNVKKYSLIENKFTGFGSDEYLLRVRELYDRSVEIDMMMAETKIPLGVNLSLLLRECIKKCNEMRNDSYSYKGMKQPRIDPIHICLLGAPGVGKSAITHKLINDLLDLQNEPQVDRIFTRCCADAYWSNYHQEPAILYDDLGAIKSSLRLSDFAEIMGIKTNDPYTVPMAIAEEKGKHCLSKYLFSCTNVANLDDTGDVVTKSAYYRRRNILTSVSRDPNVPMNPLHPEQGLLFTVLHNDQIKTVWDEAFLADVDTLGWRFENVSYDVFLDYCDIFTKHYMNTQRILVESLTKRKPIVEEEEVSLSDHIVCEPQGAEKVVSMREIIDYFDSKQIQGFSLYDDVGLKNKDLTIRKLKTKKVLTFENCIASLCNCKRNNFSEVCDAKYVDVNGILSSLVSRGINADGETIGSCFGAPRLNTNCLEDGFVLRRGKNLESIFSSFTPAAIFFWLLTYVRLGISGTELVCPLQLFQHNKNTLKVLEVNLDDDDYISGLLLEEKEFRRTIEWPGLKKFAPALVEEFGGIVLKDDKGWIFLTCGKKIGDPDLAFKGFLSAKCCYHQNILAFVDRKVKGLVSQMGQEGPLTVKDFNQFDEEVNKNFSRMWSILGESSDYVSALILFYQRIFSNNDFIYQLHQRNERRAEIHTLEERYQVIENKVSEGLSNSVKIGMAIAGGLIGVASLASIGYAVSKFFQSATQGSTENNSAAKEEEQVVEEISIEEADTQGMTGAHESGAERTLYNRRMRVNPRFKVTTIRKEGLTGAHESCPERTLHRAKNGRVHYPKYSIISQVVSNIIFISGNPGKISEFSNFFGERLKAKKLDLAEIQGDPDSILRHKLWEAQDITKSPVVVEDTSLFFEGIRGFPGPYVKSYLECLGLEGLVKIANDSGCNRGRVECRVGFCFDNNDEGEVFIGIVNGTIVSPRGSNGFGWDSIFQPDGCTKTLAEMTDKEKSEVSFRTTALIQLKTFLDHEIRKVDSAQSLQGMGVTYDEKTVQVSKKSVPRKSKVSLLNPATIFETCIKQAITGDNFSVAWNTHTPLTSPSKEHDKTDLDVMKKILKQIDIHFEEKKGDFIGGTRGIIVTKDPNDVIVYVRQREIGKKEVVDRLRNGSQCRVIKQAWISTYGSSKDNSANSLIQSHVLTMSACIFNATRNTTMHVLCLRDTFILMPVHYCEELSETDEVYFITISKVTRVYVEWESMKLVSRFQDLVVWNLGKNVPPSKDYMKHIPTSDDWLHYSGGQGSLCLTLMGGNHVTQTVHSLEKIETCCADIEEPTGMYEIFGKQHIILAGLRYRANCAPGFCGAAIVRSDVKMQRKICGMHVAGTAVAGVGYAEKLIFEILEACINSFDNQNSYSLDSKVDALPFPTVVAHCPIPSLGNLGVMGKIEDDIVQRNSSKTTVVPSCIHGMIGKVLTEPSILSSWDYRLGDKRGVWDPLYDAVTKYGENTIPFDTNLIEMVEDHLVSVYKGRNNSIGKRCVNTEEIGINGIDLSDYWQPINLKTSPGFPYVLSRPSGENGKRYLFKEEEDCYASGRAKYSVQDQELRSRIDALNEDLDNGVVPQVITVECLKDERRKLSKIYDKPATRSFTILPCDINILFRMYFGDFAAMVMSNRFDLPCQVGIDPNTSEWTNLMQNLLNIGKFGFAGDYGKFDGVGAPAIFHSIINIVNAWYDDGKENAQKRHLLISSIIHRNGLAGEWCFKYSQGMPSGFSMTVIFNSFVNYYYMAMAWISLVGESNLSPNASLRDFDTYTKIIVYGDDNVVAVDDHFLNIYNLKTVATYLNNHGITYTDDAKNPIEMSVPFVPIHTVTFLKREFQSVGKSNILWKAPLNRQSIEEQCHWIRACEDPEKALDDNIINALYEASIHGSDYFHDLFNRLNEAYERRQMSFPPISFRECQLRWWSNISGSLINQPDLNKFIKTQKVGDFNLDHRFVSLDDGTTRSLKDILERAKMVSIVQFEV
uniref:Genome polyprotein n=1 Tax=Euphorbia ebracteolata waikavirus TaxID=3115786 RepID=A0AAT9JAX7_9SECO